MPYLMHISFDNPVRLKRDVYYFEYNGVRFKLVQNNPRKWADVLLTLVEDHRPGPAIDRAFSAAADFASALGWENRVGIPVRHVGGYGVPNSFRLRQARCGLFTIPTVPYRGQIVGCSMTRIAKITSEEQRIALSLFREARSSNKELLSLLLYWQVLDIRHNPVEWTNEIADRQPEVIRRVGGGLDRLPLQGRSLGEYLLDDRRHAIAHIRRYPGKTTLKFNDSEEHVRLAISARVTQELAEHYIRTELGVTESLYLVRRRGREFPVYLDKATIVSGPYELVHELGRRSLKGGA